MTVNALRRAAIIDAVTALDTATLLPTTIRADVLAGACATANALLFAEKLEDIDTELRHIISDQNPIILGGKCYRGYTKTALLAAIDTVVGPAPDTFDPVDDATGVANNGDLTVTFDKVVSPRAGNVSIYVKSGDTLVESWNVATEQGATAGKVEFDDEDMILHLTTPLAFNTEHYIVWDAGIVEDSDGNVNGALAEDTWSFTTATATTVSTRTPADNATGASVSNNLVVTFSRNVELGSGVLELRLTADDTLVESFAIPGDEGTSAGQIDDTGADEITFNPTSNMAGATSHYVLWTDGAFIDSLGQLVPAVTSKTAWNFTTT